MRRDHRRRLPAVACTRAVQVGCPHAPSRHSGKSAACSRWLRSTCAFACRCNARFSAWLLLFGVAGIVGFCAAVLSFRAGFLSEATYLACVAASLSMFVASVVIAHLGDPHAWQRASDADVREPAEVLSFSARRIRAAQPRFQGPQRQPQ